MTDEALPTFESLIAPLSWEEFVRDVWDQEYRVFRAEDGRSFETLFSKAAAEQLVSTGEIRAEFLRLIRDGVTVPRSRYTTSYRAVRGLLDEAKIAALYREGTTLEFNAIERFWPPLDCFCKHLEEVFGCRTDAVAFLSPPNPAPADDHRALREHYDCQDLLIMQISGHKRWRLFGTPHPKPLDDQFWQPGTHQPGALREEVVLKPGDMIYLMHGTVHDAVTEGEHSLHLALGIYPFRMHQALMAAVQSLADDVRFRQALRPRALTGGAVEREAFAEMFEQARQLAFEAVTTESAVAGLRERLEKAARPSRKIRFDP